LGSSYGKIDLGNGAPVNVEYVSANPTGPMHVGHCRGAVFGDALANLLAFNGFKVAREYYINDAGVQVDLLARSAFLRYREALGEKIGAIPEGLYPGDYLKPVGAAIAAEYGDALAKQSETSWLPIVRDKAVAMMMAAIRDDLAALDVKPDVALGRRSNFYVNAAMSTKDVYRRRRARPPKIGRIANRHCFVRPRSATTLIVR
jgi:arginyl-tRNA synthetase